jgi:hypothetical protein
LFPKLLLTEILEMEFVASLKVGMPPSPDRDFFELNWFYERYVKYHKDMEQSQSNSYQL